ncbi:MAG TPA: hypothetical protein PK781_01945 [Terrimesophilobacter sp.]|nr:hypothetical protein [Terrimesophilobacter sp.]HRP99205.1 hypothetical protein [Terrimesophilobacter sp.]
MTSLSTRPRRTRRALLATGGAAVCAVLLTGCTMTDIEGAINQIMMFFQVFGGSM